MAFPLEERYIKIYKQNERRATELNNQMKRTYFNPIV